MVTAWVDPRRFRRRGHFPWEKKMDVGITIFGTTYICRECGHKERSSRIEWMLDHGFALWKIPCRNCRLEKSLGAFPEE